MKIAVVGATGLVGGVMLEVLAELGLAYDELLLVASERSVGKEMSFEGKTYSVIGMQDAVDRRPDLALFSAGGATSKAWAPKFAEVGCIVIDNSSAWRMETDVPLVVPEVNADAIQPTDKIIANPNCSTIQLVTALRPLHQRYGIDRLVISTYQSYTGTGKSAVDQYQAELKGEAVDYETTPYPHPIFANCLPHCDVFLENDYTKEEMKLVHETRKILGDQSIGITATAVRVPVNGGHSEAVNIQFSQDYDIAEVKKLLSEAEGVTVLDDVGSNTYPMPLYAKDKNDVFVGRIRRDESIANGLNLWIVSDNLRKGAATNAVQIAQYLIQENMLTSKVDAAV